MNKTIKIGIISFTITYILYPAINELLVKIQLFHISKRIYIILSDNYFNSKFTKRSVCENPKGGYSYTPNRGSVIPSR